MSLRDFAINRRYENEVMLVWHVHDFDVAYRYAIKWHLWNWLAWLCYPPSVRGDRPFRFAYNPRLERRA